MAIMSVILAYLLNTLQILCGCQTVRRRRFEEDVEEIRRDLLRLEAILRNYDAREDDHDKQADQRKINQLRVASFIAADALEGYDNLPLAWLDVEPCGTFKSIKRQKPLIEIASAIKISKSTVSKLLNEIEMRQGNHLIRELLPSELYYSTSRRHNEAEVVPEDHDLVGIEAPSKKLMELLLDDDPRLKVISVAGMGGSGKTTLVKKVYDDVRFKNRFRYHVWATISQSFNMDELLKDIIRQIYAVNMQPIPRGVETIKVSYLGKMVQDSLRASSYLLILDDLWSIIAWNDIIKTLPISKRSRIVLTTRDLNIAPPSCPKFETHIHRMDKLSQDESKILFCRKAFQDGICPPHLEETLESILNKCDGLPLAINSIGGFLRKKEMTSEWKTVNHSLDFEMRTNAGLDFMKKILTLSYNELPDEIKLCFLYFSMFPEDKKIEYNRLIRLWIAEKFVHPIEEKTVEEVAEEYFKILVNRNLIQAAETRSDGRIKTCRVHDMLHKICILKSRDQKFAAIHKDGEDAWSYHFRRLSIHNTWQNVNQTEKNPHLRALFVFGFADFPSKETVLSLLLKKHRTVRLLDLQAAPLKQFPREITKLVHLRYLSLRHTKVETIPISIGNLKNLETLDLKHARVSKLPASIVKLQKLRVLLVYRYDQIESYTHFHYKYGFEPPNNIGKLKSLQKLGIVEATRWRRHTLTELGKLSQLRRLLVIELREEDGTALWSSIQNLRQLRTLSITSVNEEEIIALPDYDQPSPQCLQRLYLTGPLKKLPNWIPMVTSLVRLSLKGSQLDHAPLVQLQDLPRLEYLELFQVYNGKELHFEDGGFRKLKVLGLDRFDELEIIKVDQGAMPNLEKLIIQRCTVLKEVPIGIEHLTRIKVLELFDMPRELIQRLRIGGEDNRRIAHIPQAYSTHWNRGWESDSLDGHTPNVRESINPFGK
ncbi:Disease resistance protein [Corchorus olitorius]|uniref:Disease resistance protein n=1 Tax=Corchorus olitorius TaxID=93759 RepID=A0A1R3HFW8_9ROSI|nr:Disease resistance protein [Corchorus olitorius]